MVAHQEHVVIIIPALNEEQTIGSVITECHEALDGRSHEILVVDGHSSDDTVKISREKGAHVVVQKGSGYGDALLSGFGYALRTLKPDIVVMMDADGTYRPQNINDLLTPILNDQADFVIGNRFASLEKESMPFINRVGNRFFSGLSGHLFKIPSLDTQSGFRAFKAEMLSHLIFKNPGMPLASEMIIEAKNANYRIVQVPVAYDRRTGNSKLRPMRDGFLILGTLIRLYRDISPLFFFGAIGIFFLAIGGILTIYTLMLSVAGTGPSFVLTISSAVMFVSGLIIIAIGLLADMIKDIRERQRIFHMQLVENLLRNNNKNTEPTQSNRETKE